MDSRTRAKKNKAAPETRFLRFPSVQAKTGGLSRSTIWRLEHEGRFPKRRVVSPKIVVWDGDEIDAWILEQGGGCGLVPGTRKTDESNDDEGAS